jgi:hypothetical protein
MGLRDVINELKARVQQLTEELNKTDDAFEKVVLRKVILAIVPDATTIQLVGTVGKYKRIDLPGGLAPPPLNPEMDAKRKKALKCIDDYNQSLAELEELERRAIVTSNLRIMKLVEEFGERAEPRAATSYYIRPDFDKPNPKKQRTKE